ncbi:MAG: lipocalin family protein [Candidatus Cloacimonetes bacterium]|nr:lipocalin family protein [Candidatus Cloacimonadota bacterium]
MIRIFIILILASLLWSCQKEFKTVAKVDLQKFMGDWYVIGILPNPIEKTAANGIETYVLNPDGSIGITYTYRKGGPQGKVKTMHPRGRIHNHQTNAEWRVQLLKPFWFVYLVVDLADDYRYTVISVPNKKFVWIMSRSPKLSDEDYAGIIQRLDADGYNTSEIIKMPQVW